MADLNAVNNKKKKRDVRSPKRHAFHVDMTPMTDLGFLLMAFFVFTAELNKPMVAELYMPADGQPMNIGESNALTILLAGNGRIFYYNGSWENAISKKEIFETGYSYNNGIGNVIRNKQKLLASLKNEKNEMMLIIKTHEKANYGNMVDILDEVLINAVKKYALVKLTKPEALYIDSAKSH